MNERLEQFLAAENITQAAFADTIKVARASVSHILSGRNKPGYEFFASLIKNYPSLNIEWLITGKGRMYKDMPPTTLFSTVNHADDTTLFKDEAEQPVQEEDNPDDEGVDQEQIRQDGLFPLQTPPKQRKASKIIVFYDDGTFEEFMK